MAQDDAGTGGERSGPVLVGGPAGVPVSQLQPALLWLIDEGHVSVSRLAGVLGITPLYVRQLLYRQRRNRRRQRSDVNRLDAQPVRIGARDEEDSSAPLVQRDKRVDEFIGEIETIRATFGGSLYFMEAARRLKQLQQFRGFPSNRAWLRFMARVYKERAWFLVHSGYSATAIIDARSGLEASRLAYQASRTTAAARDDLTECASTALILSQAYLLQQRPNQALGTLELVEGAVEGGMLQLGSDYYRQRGVCLLQLATADHAAQRYFAKSAEIMEDLGEASCREEVRYTGARHLYLLMKDWEHAFELAREIAAPKSFGPASLHASVATHWAVAAAFSVDSASVHRQALALLEANAATAASFGHQRTLYTLLAHTLELGLTPAHQAAWVRYALYLNAFRNR